MSHRKSHSFRFVGSVARRLVLWKFPLAHPRWLDLLVGGIGIRRGRRDPEHVQVGDALDCWRVEAYEPPRRLRLRAEMKLLVEHGSSLKSREISTGVRFGRRRSSIPSDFSGCSTGTESIPCISCVCRMLRNLARARRACSPLGMSQHLAPRQNRQCRRNRERAACPLSSNTMRPQIRLAKGRLHEFTSRHRYRRRPRWSLLCSRTSCARRRNSHSRIFRWRRGRVRTDEMNGFRLDRGFQVLQTAYSRPQRMLDYPSLRLQPFEPGALIRTRGKFVIMGDPWRRPSRAWSTAFNGIGELADRWRLLKMRNHVARGPEEALWSEPDSTTADYLRQEVGLSADMVERFFRPWFSGVFFENELNTSSRFLSLCSACLPWGTHRFPPRGWRQFRSSSPLNYLRSVCDSAIESNRLRAGRFAWKPARLSKREPLCWRWRAPRPRDLPAEQSRLPLPVRRPAITMPPRTTATREAIGAERRPHRPHQQFMRPK
jgi:hypothetical protein